MVKALSGSKIQNRPVRSTGVKKETKGHRCWLPHLSNQNPCFRQSRTLLSCLSFLFSFFPILNLEHFRFIYKQPKRTMQEQRKYNTEDSDIGFKNYDFSSFSQLLKKVMTSSNPPGFQVHPPCPFALFIFTQYVLSTFMCINGLIWLLFVIRVGDFFLLFFLMFIMVEIMV